MASAWGKSWGVSWGNSWGTITAAVVAAVLIADASASVGGSDTKAAILKHPTVIEHQTNLRQLLVEDEEVLAIVGLLIEAGIFDGM